MKKIVLLLLLLGGSLHAQLLYQITGNGLKEPSYLFGTIHMMPNDDFKLSNSLKRAFDASSTLAMEVDINMSGAEKIAIAKQVLLPEGKTLKDFMAEKEFIALKQFCMDSLSWSESKFERSSKLKPMFFSSIMIQESLKDMASYEMELNKMAKKKHKKVMGLETIEFQLSLFDQLPMTTQIGMLQTDLENNLHNIDTLVECYLSEDLEKLNVLMNAETESYPEFTELMLNNRNLTWIAAIDKQMHLESTFFAVGAGHLAGPQGVVALLRDQGFKVTAIKQD
jgi:uncharacterized protein YbaP (TraB family)